nr:SNF2-related, N-terminal domain-containing protein [Tanacetum cinerariifolium]
MEESSKKGAMSLNQLHARFITASKTKSTPYTLLPDVEMKNKGDRLMENDAPSFNLSDFDDSPPPMETMVRDMNEEKVSAKGGVETKNRKQQADNDIPSFSFDDFDSPSRKSVLSIYKGLFGSQNVFGGIGMCLRNWNVKELEC